MNIVSRNLSLVALGLLSIANVANAQTSAVSITGNGSYGSVVGTWGWQFSVTNPLTVTDLGMYDRTGNGLSQNTQVGLWRDSDQMMLGTVTVPANGTLINGYRYDAVTPFNLVPGDTYRVAFFHPNGNISDIGFNAQGAVFAPDITYLNTGVFNFSTFAYPGTFTNSNLPKYLGANFRYSAPNTAVPEPGSIALLVGAGVGGLMLRRRKK